MWKQVSQPQCGQAPRQKPTILVFGHTRMPRPTPVTSSAHHTKLVSRIASATRTPAVKINQVTQKRSNLPETRTHPDST